MKFRIQYAPYLVNNDGSFQAVIHFSSLFLLTDISLGVGISGKYSRGVFTTKNVTVFHPEILIHFC